VQKFLIEAAILGCFIGLACFWDYLDKHHVSDHPCKFVCLNAISSGFCFWLRILLYGMDSGSLAFIWLSTAG
jgi:hypothetical protein